MSTHNMLSEIGRLQNLDENLRRQASARRQQSRAKLCQLGGGGLAVAIALAAPLAAFFAPAGGPFLGAAAAAWIFVSRLFLRPMGKDYQAKGAILQEDFDCRVLGLLRNASIPVDFSQEDVLALSRKADLGRFADWYAADEQREWPTSVLVCQRSNAVWSRRQHFSFAKLLGMGIIADVLIGVVSAAAQNSSLTSYLSTIALPSLPALLDGGELVQAHRASGRARSHIEALLNEQITGVVPTDESSLRSNQDLLFAERSTGALVPEWFYRLVSSRYEEDMRYAVRTTE